MTVHFILLSRFHVAKTVKGMKGGLKAFTALNDYYMHIQTRDIEQFPVCLMLILSPRFRRERTSPWA